MLTQHTLVKPDSNPDLSTSPPPCGTPERRPTAHTGSSPGSRCFSDAITAARLGASWVGRCLSADYTAARGARVHSPWCDRSKESLDACGEGREAASSPSGRWPVSPSPGVPERWPGKSCLSENMWSRLDRPFGEVEGVFPWERLVGQGTPGQRILGLGVTSAGSPSRPLTSPGNWGSDAAGAAFLEPGREAGRGLGAVPWRWASPTPCCVVPRTPFQGLGLLSVKRTWIMQPGSWGPWIWVRDWKEAGSPPVGRRWQRGSLLDRSCRESLAVLTLPSGHRTVSSFAALDSCVRAHACRLSVDREFLYKRPLNRDREAWQFCLFLSAPPPRLSAVHSVTPTLPCLGPLGMSPSQEQGLPSQCTSGVCFRSKF